MAENKFIKQLKGTATAGSVLEIKNQGTPATFGNMPSGTSSPNTAYADARGDATGVLKGTDNWKLNGSTLTLATQVFGDGRDFTDTYTASGSSLWVNATYTFANPQVFTANTKWVLKLCGANLLSAVADTIDFSLIVKFGSTSVVAKNFTVAEQANNFCRQFVIDFNEGAQNVIKATNGDTMTIQLLCGDSTASATIYNGMTTLTALQRRVDGDAVASASYTFEELETEVINLIAYVDNTFLPLAGGTMTGDLCFQYNSAYPVLRIIQSGQNTNHLRFINNNSASQSISMDLSQAAIHPLVTGRGHVGTSNIHFGDAYIDKIYTGVINNGYDISVPVTASADSVALESEITDINGKIPAQASSSNQLADKSFVNSSIATNTANFIGTFNSVAELEAYSGTVTNNDYAFVVGVDGDGNTVYNRYKYTTATTPASWAFEYALNNSSFTAAQWATINSGGTTADVALARSAVQPAGVGNGTITLTQGGTPVGSFTTNQSANTTIALNGGSNYTPDLFDYKWRDGTISNTVWALSDGNWINKTDAETAYTHLAHDAQAAASQISYPFVILTGGSPYGTFVRATQFDETGTDYPYAYANVANGVLTLRYSTSDTGAADAVYYNGSSTGALGWTVDNNGVISMQPTNFETIGGTTVMYWLASDGHKIVVPAWRPSIENPYIASGQDTAVADIYTATGTAWYYILDDVNQRFKLPRALPFTGAVIGNGVTLGFVASYNDVHYKYGALGRVPANQPGVPVYLGLQPSSYGQPEGSPAPGTIDSTNWSRTVGLTTEGDKSGVIAERGTTDQYKYLYFYVGT